VKGIVEELLTERAGRRVGVLRLECLATARGDVIRMHLDSEVPGIGSSVVAKRRALGEWSSSSAETERAALLALAHSGLAPVLLGGADDVLVMTDVGATTVEQLLFGADPEAARQGLLAMASTTAALHRCEPPPRGRRTWTVGTHGLDWSAVSLGVTALNLPSPAAAEQDVTEVLRELAVGSRFVHGDLTPNNAVIGTDGRCRLVDLEGASAQHLGVDACMLRFPFAWYGRWAQLPTSVLMEIQAMYQQEVRSCRRTWSRTQLPSAAWP
jgi:hypothetical protein